MHTRLKNYLFHLLHFFHLKTEMKNLLHDFMYKIYVICIYYVCYILLAFLHS